MTARSVSTEPMDGCLTVRAANKEVWGITVEEMRYRSPFTLG
jgi:hypothetical protein